MFITIKQDHSAHAGDGRETGRPARPVDRVGGSLGGAVHDSPGGAVPLVDGGRAGPAVQVELSQAAGEDGRMVGRRRVGTGRGGGEIAVGLAVAPGGGRAVSGDRKD